MYSFEQIRDEALRYVSEKNKSILEEWCKQIGYNRPIGYHNDLVGVMVIYAEYPGLLIGKAGKNVDLLKNKLAEEFHNMDYVVEFKEIRGGFVNINKSEE